MSAVGVPASGDLPAGTSVGRDPLQAAVPPPEVVPVETDDMDGPDAAARLAESRERLRLAMVGPPPASRGPAAARPGSTAFASSSIAGTLRRLLARARALPAAEVVIDAVETWWAGHPLHTAGSMAADASKAYVQPIARRNPIALVVGSAVIGALFFLTKPWRWALRPVLLAGLLPQIVSHTLRRAPVGSWLNVATAFAKARTPVRRPRAAAPAAAEAMAATADAAAFVRPTAVHDRLRDPMQDPVRD